MGLVKPPWITKKWFKRCLFNYCDHFGNRARLSLVCIICRDHRLEKAYLSEDGKDLDDPQEFFNYLYNYYKNPKNNLEAQEKKKNFHIGISTDKFFKKYESIKVYKMATGYGKLVDDLTFQLVTLPKSNHSNLLAVAVNSLAHSEHYVSAKIYRALSSLTREMNEKSSDLYDSKTSAMFAYMAIDRNIRTVNKFLVSLKENDLNRRLEVFISVSHAFKDEVRKSFFPEFKGEFEEFGADEYY